jgi:hypothetical protein
MPSEINIDQLLASMVTAAAGALQERWPIARDYAETEFRKLLIQAEHIKNLKSENRINEDEAKLLMDLQRNAMRSILLALEGLGILAVEAAINAALGVIRDAVNNAIGSGWKIL